MKTDLCSFAVIGGDMRQVYLAELLARKGFTVFSYGLCSECKVTGFRYRPCRSLQDALERTSNVVLPIPMLKDTMLWGSPQLSNLAVNTLTDNMGPGSRLFAGCIPGSVRKLATEHRIQCYDFLKNEETAWRNTIAAAEGMIAEAIQRSPRNLSGSFCLVLGYGKCGSTLVSYLRHFSQNISIYEKETNARARAAAYGEVISSKQLPTCLQKVNYIFNTIPDMVLTESFLRHVNRDTLILDLASAPGGVDYESAAKLGIQAVLLPGLPGKYAPLSSAEILLDYILRELNSESL